VNDAPAQTLRVGFAGTPEFAAVALDALLAAGLGVPLVLTQPDRPAGRGLKLTPSPVKQRALAAGLPVAQPRSLRLDGKFPDDAHAAQAALQAADLDVLVVAAYGLILPAWVLATPRRGCINIHASLLPRWRGAAPIHRAIEAGDTQTGITLMQMDQGLDTGPMRLAQAVAIEPGDTTGTLHDKLAALGGRLLVQLLADLDRWPPVPQPDTGATYAAKIDKAEARIDWTQPAAVIERKLRAFDPQPGCSFDWNGQTFKLWRATVVRAFAPGVAPGTARAEAGGLTIACGQDALRVEQLQAPGGRRLPAAAVLASLRSSSPASRS
jgi:methionyl-tRNA formyltransferase